jgi:hypothetical protein
MCLLDRCAAEPEIRLGFLGPQLLMDGDFDGFLGDVIDAPLPFSVATIEKTQRITGLKTHNIRQIMRLLERNGDRLAYMQSTFDIDTGKKPDSPLHEIR